MSDKSPGASEQEYDEDLIALLETVWGTGFMKNTDVPTQTQQTLAKIDKLLAECGTDKSKLLWAQLWVTDMRNFEAMNGVWDAWVEPGHPPVRADRWNGGLPVSALLNNQ